MSLATLARMLGVKPSLAEDALHSERAARAVLSRRHLFAASGALAAGSVFSFARPYPSDDEIMDVFAGQIVAMRNEMASILQIPERMLYGYTFPLAEESDAQLKRRIKRMLREEIDRVHGSGKGATT